jgi:hypothetical protein
VCAVLVDSRAYSGPLARLSIPLSFYVQTKNTTAIPLEVWITASSECVEKWTIPEQSSLAAAIKGVIKKCFILT